MYSQDGGRDDGDEGSPNPDTNRSRGEPDPQRPPAPQQVAQGMQNAQNAPDDGTQSPLQPPFADKNSGAQSTSSPPTVMPTEARFLARQPTHKAENPHCKARPYEQTLSGPEDVGADVSFQRNDGSFDAPVIDCMVALENVEAGFVATLKETPEDWTLVAFHLGGSQMFEAWGIENLTKAVISVLTHARLAVEDNIELFALAADNKHPSKNLYGHPCVMAMRVPNHTIQARLCDIGTFPSERDLTFAVVSFDPNCRTWTISLWKVLSRAEKPTTGPRLCWAVAKAILMNPAVVKAVERATGATDTCPIFDRLLTLAHSVNVCFNPHSRHWCAYAKPCTADAKLWEEVRAAIRTISLRHNAGMLAFEPVQTTRGNEPPWCQYCKNDDHVHFGCPFPLDNSSTYWGPAETALAQIKTGILSRNPKKGGETARGGKPKQGGARSGGGGQGGYDGGSQGRGGSNRGGRW
ncbi:hypothetical protein DFH08DRAFT_966175 [Mycena albidolilacea]|uniref:Uncharacterized protein n=1 Tax=Mycena albidolilacea TaxID=1033008 RepID=A0AAD6ZPB3_9AGAR|nr:hypothetical protein DFH08DRAFT_966175 [Mycena albidolilacea]